MDRNPVSVSGAKTMSDDEVVSVIRAMPSESIYDEPGRLAQPDEVWNFNRGDGVEKAILLAVILKGRTEGGSGRIEVLPDKAVLILNGQRHEFTSAKGLRAQVWEL